MARRVPVLLQMSTTECGAACLAMVLSYFGRATSVSECHDLCGAGRDGASAKTIATTARALGLSVRAYRAEPEALRQLPLPAIAHIDFNHFVVLERMGKRHVDVVDPSAGRLRLSFDSLDQQFTGVVLSFSRTDSFEKRKGKTANVVGPYALAALGAQGVRRGLAQLLMASLVQHTVGLAIVAFPALVFDRLLPQRAAHALDGALLGLGLLVIGQVILAYLRGAMLAYVQARLDTHLMGGFFQHLLSLPLRYFEERSSGDLLMRMAGNTAVRDIVGTQLLGGVLDGLFMCSYFGLLLWLAPGLGVVALGAALLQVALLYSAHRATQGLIQQELSTQAASQGYLIEALKGVRTLKAGGSANEALSHWSTLFLRASRVTQQRTQRIAALDALLLGVRVMAPLALLWAGGRQAIAGHMTVGGMWAAVGLAAAALAPTASLVASAQKWMLARAELDRIVEALQSRPEQHGCIVAAAPMLSGSIDVADLFFRYSATSPWAIENVSLSIQPGDKIAIVGRSGSGKSTLLSLLLGLYEPSAGTIRYDGQSLSSLDHDSLRRQIGVVTQEPFIFSGSIRDNLVFDAPDLAPEQLQRAAELAALTDDIAQMPMGFETLVGEGGIALSGGQRQRMAIARALAKEPALLMLDEATSQLDNATEAAITTALTMLGQTRIVVAHRLSTIIDADVICVMDQGRLVERGTHSELLGEGGVYAALYRAEDRITATPTDLLSISLTNNRQRQGKHYESNRHHRRLEERHRTQQPQRGRTRTAPA